MPTQSLMENLASGISAEALARRPEMRFVPSDKLAEWTQEKSTILSPARRPSVPTKSGES